MNKAVFLDRDGTINVDHGYVHRAEDFEFLPGAVDGLRMLQEAGYLLVVVTNQSGIGRGMFTKEEYLEFQQWFEDELARQGVTLTVQYFCPHVDADGCDCRKPKIGLFEQAARDYDIDWASSYAIGDRMRDLTVCEAHGVRGFLIDADGAESEVSAGAQVVESLLEAAKQIVTDM